jgi:ribosomal protein L11 methylase PrmA
MRGSFRDPSGFVFSRDDVLYRQVNQSYRQHYDALMSSGLHAALLEDGLLIPHEEVDVPPAAPESAYKVIRPQAVPFVSYPYEWCFSQLKDAALTTLAIQKKAMEFGMTLKDASAYNVQFIGGRCVLIDSISFEKQVPGRPWVAYRQFCQHFLAPLALMSRRDVRLGQMLRAYIDGIPLDLASRLLPRRTRLSFSLLAHIHLHARYQRNFADKGGESRERKMSQMALTGLIEGLCRAVAKLSWRPAGTEWAEYYDQTSYSQQAVEHKSRLVGEFLQAALPQNVWDLGANTGVFSRIASAAGIPTVAFDVDPAAVERNYLQARSEGNECLLPLVMDLTNPSSAIGWANEERLSLAQRGPADAALALALVHHLAIGNNVPLPRIAEMLSRLCRSLIVEFVPKEDPQVQRMLASREDIFADYERAGFERAFDAFFSVQRVERISDSPRTLYLMTSR